MSASTIPLTLWANQELKTCTSCGVAKPKSVFNKQTVAKDGLAWQCRECSKKYGAAYFRSVHGRAVHRMHGRRQFGIDMDEKTWEELFESQGRVCAACGTSDPGYQWATDHDHSTGKVRGILCNFCNVRLVMAAEHPNFPKVLSYLERFK
jgi:Recombination endonuclease VII